MIESTGKIDRMLVCGIRAVDVFCGVGGLTRGLEDAGIDVTIGIDIDPACEYPYNQNNNATFRLKSVENIEASDLREAFGDVDFRLLAGCAPCQTFSSYNQKADVLDERWWLLRDFSRLVRDVKPEFVTMENVPGLEKHEVFEEFLNDLDCSGYCVNYGVVSCEEYGIPQYRKRLVLLASRLGKIELLTPEQFGAERKSVRKAIGDLRPIGAGEADPEDPLHRSCVLSDLNMKRMKASRPGGTWRDWPEELVTRCHRSKSGKTYPGVYGRMKWTDPSPTLTTQFYGFGNGRFGHPEQDRAISLREGAILQTFPNDYKFVTPGKKINKKALGRLIGNAVPVKLGEVIGKSFLCHIASLTQIQSEPI